MPKPQSHSQKPFTASIPGLVASAKKRRATNRLQKRSAKAAALDALAGPKLSKALERFSEEGTVLDANTEEDESDVDDAPLGSLSVFPPFSSPASPSSTGLYFYRKPVVGQLLRVGACSKY